MVDVNMAENPSNPSKVEENPASGSESETDPSLLSLEKLDELIGESDPDFAKALSEMAPEGGASDLNIELIDLDKVLEAERANSLKSRWRRLILHFRSQISIFVSAIKANFIIFAKEDLPKIVKQSKDFIVRNVGLARQGLRAFGFWPLKKKLAVFGIIAGALFFFAYLYAAWKWTLIPQKTELFTISLESGSDSSEVYDPATQTEFFYDSSRASQNIISLQRMVVNLRRSGPNGPNTMGAFEFFVEGNSPDVMVEIKDREYEVKDLFQRTIEEMSFEQLDNVEGKQLLLEKLRREANRMLTKGQVRKIFFKTAILKD